MYNVLFFIFGYNIGAGSPADPLDSLDGLKLGVENPAHFDLSFRWS